MVDTNYIETIVKVLDFPKQKLLANNSPVTKFRVQLPEPKNTQIVNLLFWGNLATDAVDYYKVNDYILIEGYVSFHSKKIENFDTKTVTKTIITVMKSYPFLLSSKE